MANEIIWSEKFGNYIQIDQGGDFVKIATEDDLENEFNDVENWDKFDDGTHDD